MGRRSTGGYWLSYRQRAKPPKLYGGSLVAKLRSKPVVATNVATGKKRTYPSAKIAGAALGMSRAAICLAVHSKLKASKGWRFRFA